MLEFAKNHTPDELHSDTVYDGLNIYNWIKFQRKRYESGKIKDERQVEIMQNILQIFPRKTQKARADNTANNTIPHWDVMYEATVQYYNEHGFDASVPADYLVDGRSLRNWIATEQGIVWGSIDIPRTAEQLEKLAKIGITPDKKNKSESAWDKQYERLKTFIDERGYIPKNNKKKPDEFYIAIWIYNQRKKFRQGKMTEEHIRLLRELGIEL